MKTDTRMKHTAGKWEVSGDRVEAGNKCIAILNELSDGTKTANGLLIAEAGTVASEVGLSPRQLAEQRQELLDALVVILPLAKGYAAAHQVGSNQKYIEAAEAAVAEARGEPVLAA